MNRNFWILAAVFFTVSFFLFLMEEKQVVRLTGALDEFTLGDVIWYLQKGTDFTVENSENTKYILPFFWVMHLTLLHLLTGAYPLRDLERCGLQVILKSGSRKRWFFSKALWTAATCILFDGLRLVLTGVLTFLFHGRMSFSLTNMSLIFGAEELSVNEMCGNGPVFLWLVVIPLCVHITLTLVQLALMFLVGSQFAILALLITELTATCIPSGFLIANYSMGLRIGRIVPWTSIAEEGKMCGILCVVLLLAAILLGVLYSSKKDIL